LEVGIEGERDGEGGLGARTGVLFEWGKWVVTRELIGRRGDSWVCIVNVIDENGIREGRERERERERDREGGSGGGERGGCEESERV